MPLQPVRFRRSRPLAMLAGLLLTLVPAVAQHPTTAPTTDAPLSEEDRQAAIDAMGQALIEQYIFEDVALVLSKTVHEYLESGKYDDLTDPQAFADQVTEDLQGISNDRHLRLLLRSRVVRRRQQDPRDFNYGFSKVEHLDGNVGFLDLRGFMHGPEAIARADATMALLQDVDALIIDLRFNGGGTETMLRHLASYFFDGEIVLLTDETRDTDGPVDILTDARVDGGSLTDVPLYLLTSTRTFSAAEAFTFSMKRNDRVVIVGETTGGGGHYGGVSPLNETFAIWMPRGRAFDRATGKGWEGTGVEPNVSVPSDEALTVALEQAREAASIRANKRQAGRREHMQALRSTIEKARELTSSNRLDDARSILSETMIKGIEANVIGPQHINQMGYEELGQGRMKLAIAIFQIYVKQYPDDANAYDSLGEAYMNDDQINLAIRNYEKSIELDPGNDNARDMIQRMNDK